jgi:uncharacterized protein (TIGR02391 family)
MEDLKDYLKRAEELIPESYDSPKVDLYLSRLKRYLQANFSKEYAEMIDGYHSLVIITDSTDFQAEHREAMERTVEFLKDLIESEETPSAHGANSTIKLITKDLEGLNPKILAASEKLYRDQHYREAIGNAFMVVKDRLRDITGYENSYPAFDEGGLYIKGALAENVDDNFQEGVKRLLGAIDKFRNEKFHTSERGIDDEIKALGYLYMCNLALSFIDNDNYAIRRK